MANSGWKSGRAPRDYAKILKGREQAAKAQTKASAKQALGLLNDEAARRDYSAKRISKQDSTSGQDQTLSRTRRHTGSVSDDENVSVVKFAALPYWAGARSKVVRDVLAKFGQIQDLFRRFLWVRARPGRPPHKVRFTQAPRLAGWAARADKGSQYLRHVVRINGDAIRSLALSPILRRCKDKVLKLWRENVMKAIEK